MTFRSRTPASLAALGAAGVLLAGCGSSPRPPRATPSPTHNPATRADAAVSAVQQARAAAERDADTVVAAVGHVSEQAQAAATGDVNRTGAVRASEPVDVAAVGQAAGALPADVTAYETALHRLADTLPAAHLKPTVTRGLADVVAAGEAETDTLHRFAGAATTAWAAYGALEQVVDTWYQRARAGWFRSQQEAADNFTVMTDPVRGPLDPAQQGLADADLARQQAQHRWSAAVAALDTAQKSQG